MSHILVVDDEESITDLRAQVLELYGFDVSTACTGQMALEVSGEKPVDLLVTDFQMPGMDGQELIAHMRESQPDLPAVIVSGCAHRLGSSDPLTRIFDKSVEMGKLVETINDLLEEPEKEGRWATEVFKGSAGVNARSC